MAFTGTVSSELGCLSEVRRIVLVLLTSLESDFCSGTCRFLDVCRLLESMCVLPVESGQRLIFHPCRYFFSKSNCATNKRHFQMLLSLYVACSPSPSASCLIASLIKENQFHFTRFPREIAEVPVVVLVESILEAL